MSHSSSALVRRTYPLRSIFGLHLAFLERLVSGLVPLFYSQAVYIRCSPAILCLVDITDSGSPILLLSIELLSVSEPDPLTFDHSFPNLNSLEELPASLLTMHPTSILSLVLASTPLFTYALPTIASDQFIESGLKVPQPEYTTPKSPAPGPEFKHKTFANTDGCDDLNSMCNDGTWSEPEYDTARKIGDLPTVVPVTAEPIFEYKNPAGDDACHGLTAACSDLAFSEKNIDLSAKVPGYKETEK